METISEQMKHSVIELERVAEGHVVAHRGHRSVDVQTREDAVRLLAQFREQFPAAQVFRNYAIGPRYTWRMLKSFAAKLRVALSAPV